MTARFRSLRSAALADEAFDAGVAASEAVVVDQVLVDGFGVAALAQRQFDEVAMGFAGARRGAFAGRGVGGHLIGRFCVACCCRVWGPLAGRFWRPAPTPGSRQTQTLGKEGRDQRYDVSSA